MSNHPLNKLDNLMRLINDLINLIKLITDETQLTLLKNIQMECVEQIREHWEQYLKYKPPPLIEPPNNIYS